MRLRDRCTPCSCAADERARVSRTSFAVSSTGSAVPSPAPHGSCRRDGHCVSPTAMAATLRAGSSTTSHKPSPVLVEEPRWLHAQFETIHPLSPAATSRLRRRLARHPAAHRRRGPAAAAALSEPLPQAPPTMTTTSTSSAPTDGGRLGIVAAILPRRCHRSRGHRQRRPPQTSMALVDRDRQCVQTRLEPRYDGHRRRASIDRLVRAIVGRPAPDPPRLCAAQRAPALPRALCAARGPGDCPARCTGRAVADASYVSDPFLASLNADAQPEPTCSAALSADIKKAPTSVRGLHCPLRPRRPATFSAFSRSWRVGAIRGVRDAGRAQAHVAAARAQAEARLGLRGAPQPRLEALGQRRAVLEAVARAAAQQPHAPVVLGVRRHHEVHVGRDLVLARAMADERRVGQRREAMGEVGAREALVLGDGDALERLGVARRALDVRARPSPRARRGRPGRRRRRRSRPSRGRRACARRRAAPK